MAELTKKELQAAEDRADTHSLGDDDVVLQTANTMPEGVGVKGEVLDTAGSDAHGPVYSFTRTQVRKALEHWTEREKASASKSSDEGSEDGGGSGRSRRSTARATSDQGSEGKPSQ